MREPLRTAAARSGEVAIGEAAGPGASNEPVIVDLDGFAALDANHAVGAEVGDPGQRWQGNVALDGQFHAAAEPWPKFAFRDHDGAGEDLSTGIEQSKARWERRAAGGRQGRARLVLRAFAVGTVAWPAEPGIMDLSGPRPLARILAAHPTEESRIWKRNPKPPSNESDRRASPMRLRRW